VLYRLWVLFILIPLIELALLIWIGGRIGVWQTIAMVVLTGTVGAWLIRREGFRTLGRIQENVGRGVMPGLELLDGLLILLSGALLLTPGLLTDAVALLLLVAPFRRSVRDRLAEYFRRRVTIVRMHKGREEVEAEWREVRDPETTHH
jgi:UPF0716 protein FxsA